MKDLYKAIDNLNKIISEEPVETEGKNKMGPQEITPGDRVEFEGEKFEVVDVELDTIVADNLETGLRNRLRTDKVTRIFGADAMTDQDKEDLSSMFKRLDKVPSGSLKSVATEEVQLDEKLKPFTGSYDKKTQKLVNFTMKDGERKTFVAPIDYEKPLSKTNPSVKKILDKFKSNDKKDDKPKVDYNKIKQGLPKEKPPMDIMGAGTKNKDVDAPSKKVKATASNTKDYEKTLRLQKRLIAKGADIKADGIMGPNTKAAMQKFIKPDAMPTPRPTPKSGGPDKRFITGPELDLPNMKPNNPMAPPQKKISQKNSPGNPFSPDKKIKPQIDRRQMPDLNRYAQKQDGSYKPISPNVQPKPGDSFVDRIGKGFGKMGKDLKGFGKDIYNFADKYGIASNLNRYAQKNQNKNKMANKESAQPQKTMIEQITGKKTCL